MKVFVTHVLFIPKSKMAEEKSREEMRKTTPHFWNLNEDPALTGMVLQFCKDGKRTIK